jgi:type 1 fimbria pilin
MQVNGRYVGPVVAAFLGFFLVPTSAQAGGAGDDVAAGRSADILQFDITGAITPSCALVANRIRIDLGSVAVSELPSVGEGSRWRAAAFIGADCVGATRAAVTVHAVAAAEDPRYLATTGDARGVAIELRTGSGQPVLPDGTTPVRFDLAGVAPELRFEARYVRVGPLRPGIAPGAALVQITWE